MVSILEVHLSKFNWIDNEVGVIIYDDDDDDDDDEFIVICDGIHFLYHINICYMIDVCFVIYMPVGLNGWLDGCITWISISTDSK